MAAISNTIEWKQAAMQKAERLTDIWDIVKAWAGRAAEIVLTVCMFAQLIGMLPGVNYPTFVNNAILGVQIIMLDFGAFALAPLIEHARQIGQEQAAQKAEDMATFLVRLVIVTVVLIIIGQFAPVAGRYAWLVTAVVKYSEPVLILIRVGCVVKYIHVIHSLRSTTSLAIQPISQPAQQQPNGEIAELREQITALASQITDLQSARNEPVNEPVDETPIEPTDEPRGLHLVPSDEPTNEPKREPAKGNGTAQEKAARILKKTPEITASELAKRAGCTPQYAGRLLKKQSVN
jgi:hypothetical protein